MSSVLFVLIFTVVSSSVVTELCEDLIDAIKEELNSE